MGNVIQSLISFFEIVVLGVISLGIIGYALLTFHPIVGSLVDYGKSLKEVHTSILKYIYGEDSSSKDGRKKNFRVEVILVFQGLILLGLFYFVGVVTNNASYSFLHNNNVKIISTLYRDAEIAEIEFSPEDTNRLKLRFEQQLPLSQESVNISYLSMAALPFRNLCFIGGSDNLSADEAKYYGNFLATQARIRARSKEAHEELLKFLRLQRGMILFLSWILVVSFVKVVLSAVCYLIPKRKWLYENAIDWKGYFKEKFQNGGNNNSDKKSEDNTQDKSKDNAQDNTQNKSEDNLEIKRKILSILASNLTICLLSSIFYYMAIVWYTKISVFYHVNILGSFMQE
jgi:hypothetical protein